MHKSNGGESAKYEVKTNNKKSVLAVKTVFINRHCSYARPLVAILQPTPTASR